MTNPAEKLKAQVEKLKQTVEAQRKESERIQQERQQQATNGTGQSFPSPVPPPNK